MGAREIRFVIPGKMRGKGRPRFTVINGHARAYTPAKTVSTESVVREIGAEAMGGQPILEGPLQLSIIVNLIRPISWSKKRVAESPIPMGKPDLDNVAKLIGDALNGIIWRDDSQISSLQIARCFVTDGESTEIIVRTLAAADIARAA